MQRPSLRSGTLLAAAALTLALGGAPLLTSGADHLDAPALGGLTNGSGDFAPHADHGDRDINDVYVFEGSNASRTVLAMTTNPAVNVPSVDPFTYFGTNVRYVINVDRNGNAVVDLAYVWRFGAESGGSQRYTVTRYTGANATSFKQGTQIGWGSTGGSGIGTAKDGAKVFAGVRSDPFFFDLTGFIGTVFGIGSDNLSVLDGTASDFFAPLNANAVVIEVPDDARSSRHRPSPAPSRRPAPRSRGPRAASNGSITRSRRGRRTSPPTTATSCRPRRSASCTRHGPA